MQINLIAKETETIEINSFSNTRVYSTGIRLDLNATEKVVSLLMTKEEAILMISRLSTALYSVMANA